MSGMTVEEAKELLDGCKRHELRDHAFGDAEIFWTKDGKEVATGYFGRGCASVYLSDDIVIERGSFEDDLARQLRECGTLTQVSRNDETGPDEFVEGRVAPGLSLEDVRKELTGD